MTTKQDIKEWGYGHAQGIPENNYKEPFEHCVEQGSKWPDDQEFIQSTAFNEFYDAESNSRQFSPFEFTAKELNDMTDSKPYDPWGVFEEGIHKYFREWWKSEAELRWHEVEAEFKASENFDG
jgi:hypothetical protein